MEAPSLYQEELKRIGGTVLGGQPRYRLHWLGDAMPGYESRKFESPCDCWAIIHWVDNDSEAPERGGGYAILQSFREGNKPCMLDSEGLNLNVITMMANMAEKTRHTFKEMRAKVLAKRREREQDNQGMVNKIADCLQDAVPQFMGPTSFGTGDAGQTVIQKKIEQLEKLVPRLPQISRQMGRGSQIVEQKGA